MAIHDIYSKRQRRLRGETPDVFTYDALSDPLRVQIVQIWSEAIGFASDLLFDPCALFTRTQRVLCKEYGVFQLPPGRLDARESVTRFFLDCNNIEHSLDVVELIFSEVERIDTRDRSFDSQLLTPEEAVAELNQRFREHGVGYEYRNGQLIRVDSALLHHEVVIPALQFLQQSFLKGANDEFLSAHEHYRHKRYKECLVDCLKAFESTMKAICEKRGWTYKPTDTAKPLIDTCLKNGLVPSFLDAHLGGLRAALESGLPATRNRLAGHGAGSTPVDVPEDVASYAVHLTAANILLFAESEARSK